MSGIVRLVSAPWRLAKAFRREGASRVLAFLLVTVRKRGLLHSVRFGLADRTQRERAGADEAAASSLPRAAPPDLDASYALSIKAWEGWAPLIGARPVSPDPFEDAVAPVSVRYVVRPPGSAPPLGTGSPRVSAEAARTALADPKEWIVFLKPGDTPSPELPKELARAVRAGLPDVVSFDMVRREGKRVFPILLPGANLTLLRAVDYTFGRLAVRAELVAGEPLLEQMDPRAVVLKWSGRLRPEQARGRWRHIARPLAEIVLDPDEVQAARELALAALQTPPSAGRGEAVSVVICTRDKGHLARQLVRSLLARPPEEIAEIVIVANGTANPYALQTLADLQGEGRVEVVSRDEPFNFSRLANIGARATRASGPLLFLNDDIVPVSEGWLARLNANLARAEVGAVGPLLLYPDERVQHAGMYLGFNGVAGHTLKGAILPEDDYLFTACAPREVSSLTGAVLLVRRDAFAALNGFDEQLATYLQDVDLCLRLHRSGWCNVFDPGSVLIHMESVSIRRLETRRGFLEQRGREHARFVERWGEALHRDPYHPRGFDPNDESLHCLAGYAGARPKGDVAGDRSVLASLRRGVFDAPGRPTADREEAARV